MSIQTASTEDLEKLLAQKREELKAGRRLAAARGAHDSLIEFIRLTMPDPEDPDDVTRSMYEVTPQAQLLCQIMEKVERREMQRVAVSIGPQMGKSAIISRASPAWFSGRNPRINMILGSYNQDFANEFGDDVRTIVESNVYKQIFPKYRLRAGGKAKDLLINVDNGKMAFVGVGGSGTGKPADVFIVDDPIRNDDDAQSEIYRARMWQWFTRVVNTRIHNDSAVVVVHCLTGETAVTMADGTRVRLDEIKIGDKVMAWAGGFFEPRRVVNRACQGDDDIFEVKTGNSTVRGNARHPFLVRRGPRYEWVKLADLKVGDKLVQSGVENYREEAKLSLDEAWLLGFMFGDGWLTRRDTTTFDKVRQKHYPRRAWVTCYAEGVDWEMNAEALKVFERVFGVTPKSTKFGYRRTEVQRVGRWLAEHGLVGNAKTKRLPGWLFGEPLGVRRAFLEGLVGADGTATKEHRYRRVGLANEGLTHDVRNLARSAGFRPTNVYAGTQRIKPPHSKEFKDYTKYKVSWSADRRDDITYELAIRSITPVGRAPVYDIQVEGAESFLADGLVAHNTRWHEDDLIGRLCDPDHPERNTTLAGISDEWEYINIPAVVEDPKLAAALGLHLEPQTDPLVLAQFGTRPIASVWPSRFSLNFLARQKRMDRRGFGALRMGQPAPEDGEYFRAADIIEYHSMAELPKNLRMYSASDHAVSEKQKADWTVIGCVGVDDKDDIWIMPDWTRRQMETDDTVDELMRQFKQHRPLLHWMESELISKSFGPFLRKRMQEEKTYLAIDPVVPSKDKKTRARSIQGRMRMQKVKFPAFAPWYSTMRSELLKFPYARNDDMVDVLAHIGQGLDKEVPASRTEKADDKIVTVGSIRWILADTKRKALREKAQKSLAGW